jgi:hypothetical protein
MCLITLLTIKIRVNTVNMNVKITYTGLAMQELEVSCVNVMLLKISGKCN